MGLLRDQDPNKVASMYSSFTIVEKTLDAIVQRLIANPRLAKLLVYTDRHAEKGPTVSQEQVYKLLEKQISCVPKIDVDNTINPQIIISFAKFTPFSDQTTFRNVLITIEIICPYDIWILDDFRLRPYAIAGEIDAAINHSTILKGGIADFCGAYSTPVTDELSGLILSYLVDTESDDLKKHDE